MKNLLTRTIGVAIRTTREEEAAEVAAVAAVVAVAAVAAAGAVAVAEVAEVAKTTAITETRVTKTNNRTLLPNRIVTQTNDYQRLPVGGRLVRFKQEWQKSYFRRIVSKGLTWKWKEGPPIMYKADNTWHQPTSAHMDKDLWKLCRKKVIERTKFLKFRSLLFSVPKRDPTERRTILDLSQLNEYITKTTFKMLTLRQVRLLLPMGAWTVSLDLKDGFWHVSIARAFRPYLGFRYRGQNWRFRAMPFGLNLAPKVFSKLIAFTVRCMTKKGIWCLPYLDDLLIIARSKEECLQKLQKAIEVLQRLGWIINMEKSRLEPQQVFEWLGIHYNLKKYEVRNTETQIHQFNSQMKAIWEKKTFTKRIIMRLQGLANWLGQVDPLRRTVLSHTKAFLKHLRGVPLDTTLHMDNKLRSLISIWMNLPHTIQRLGIPEPTCIIQSDASLTGYGFKIDQRSYQGNFDRSMRSYSINVLELLTIWMATLMIHKKDQAIRILSDNSTAIASINRASSVVYPLAGLTKMIWKRAAQMNWTITAAHIQGRFNVIADQLSRNTVL